MNQAGLSYDQGPPLTVPLRFFLSAPWFLLLTAGAALLSPGWAADRWQGVSLALTHLLTLGYLAMVMLGALSQMLPVIIGSPLPAARPVSTLAHLGLSLGTPVLALGLAFAEPVWLSLAVGVLVLGFMPYLTAMAISLARARSAPDVARPMAQAWWALLATLGLGLALVGGLVGWWPAGDPAELTGLHAAWGLLGWVAILIMGVAYQVVPMLQVTPDYPAILRRYLSWLLLAGLVAYSLAPWLGEGARYVAWLLLAGGGWWFAWATLDAQRRRRRRLPDVTLDFWRLGMACLAASMFAPMLLALVPVELTAPAEVSFGLLYLLGFVAAVVNGMLYKIVPFLAWFHLQTQTGARVGSIPNMKEMIPDNLARRHFRLHLAMLLLLLPAPFLPAPAAVPGVLLLAAGGQVLWLNLLRARRLFLQHGGRLG